MPTVIEIPRVDTTRPPRLGTYATDALERMVQALRALGPLRPSDSESLALLERELRRRS